MAAERASGAGRGAGANGRRPPRPGAVRYVAEAVVTVDEDHRVLRPGAVEVHGDRVAWVGPPEEAPAHGGATVVDVGGVLVPGLVNTHAHTPMTLLRSAGDGLPLQRWLEEAIWPREAHLEPDDVYWGMLLGCEELLCSGVTTTCEMYLMDEALVDAALDAGIRCVATPGIFDLPHLGPDKTWPAFLEHASSLHQAADGAAGRISVGLGPHSAYVLPPEALSAVAERARELDTLVHIHAAENREEIRQVKERAGSSVAAHLERVGLFEARCLAAHSVWLDDDDIEIYRRHGVAVAHCPGSNGKLGSGVARLADLLAAGLVVGIGTDGPASNDDLDLWQELRLAPLLARATSGHADAVTTHQALELGTRAGAAALGLDAGSLEPGRLADFVRLDTADARMVPALTHDELVAHVVWGADRSLVTDVWVGGERVVAGGSCRTVDGIRARREVARRAERLRAATGP